MSLAGSAAGGPPGGGYERYSKAYYDAIEAQRQQDAKDKGTAAGSAAGSALTALQNTAPPGVFDGSSSSSSSSSSSGSGSGGGLPPVAFPGGGGGVPGSTVPALGGGTIGASGAGLPAHPELTSVNQSGAQAAEFNRAKDLVGDVSKGALTGLRSSLASRGQLGGAGEFRGATNIANYGQKQLTDVAREQAINASKTQQDVENLRFTGGIGMRGQDIGAIQAQNELAAQLQLGQYQGGITQRGQDVTMRGQDIAAKSQAQSQQQAFQNMMLQALQSLQY